MTVVERASSRDHERARTPTSFGVMLLVLPAALLGNSLVVPWCTTLVRRPDSVAAHSRHSTGASGSGS
jgi:hypothetical protein